MMKKVTDEEILELIKKTKHLARNIFIYCSCQLPELTKIKDEELKWHSFLNLCDFRDVLLEAFERMGEIEVTQKDLEWLKND